MDVWSWLGVKAVSTVEEDAAFASFCSDAKWGLPRLWSQRHIPLHEHEYWRRWLSILRAPATSENGAAYSVNSRVATALTVTNIRRALARAPENVATLLEALVAHLECLARDENFCPPPPRSGPIPLPPGTRNRVSEALTAIQIIAHVLPVVFEGDHDTHSLIQANGAVEPRVAHLSWTFEKAVLWTSPSPPQTAAEGQSSSDPLGATDPDRQKPTVEPEGPCLGHRLLSVLLDLLFFPGFTLPWTPDLVTDFHRDSSQRARYVIWYPGVGSSTGIEGTTSTQVAHRVALLRLVLVLLSRRVYHPSPDEVLDDGLHHLATGYERPVVLALLCSLLNTILTPSKGDAGWTQWAKSWVAGASAENETSDELVLLCLQIAAILLSETTSRDEPEGDGEPTPTSKVNLFRHYLARLHRPTDYSLLWAGLSAWVQAGTYTPGLLAGESPKGEHTLEALTTLWMTLRVNVGFQAWLSLDPVKTNHLLACLLQNILRLRSQKEHYALVRTSAWIIEDLSAHGAWCACWTQPFFPQKLLPAPYLPSPPSKGTDALVLAATTLSPWALSHGSEEVATSLLRAARNTAPFWRDISVVAATKLAQLAGSLAQPKVWLVGPPRGEWLRILLECVARAWLSHPPDQVNLLYALVTGAAPDLAHLGEYDLPSALVHVHRLAAQSKGDGAEVRRKAEAYRIGSYVPTEKGVQAWQAAMNPARTVVVDHLLARLVPAVERYSAGITLKPHADQRILAFVRDWALEHAPCGVQDGQSQGTDPLRWDSVSVVVGPSLWARILPAPGLSVWAGTRVRLPAVPT